MTTAVLITGTSTGIGRATAQRLASRPDLAVYATARRPQDISDLAALGVHTLALDVTDQASMRAAVEAVEAAHGHVSVLVNNAGYAQSGAVEAVPVDAMKAEFDTNVFGAMAMAQLVLPAMRRAGQGRIINLSSVAGRAVMPGAGVYSASKFAIEALSDALRYEVAGFGVRVVVIQPGPIRTSFTTTANAAMPFIEGPYDAFHAAVATSDAEADSSRLAGDPESVAATIERAITARRPRPRYQVTAIARILPVLRGALGDRVWDRFLNAQVAAPRP